MGDPVREINTICNELRIKDASFMKGRREMHNKARAGAKAKSPQHAKKWEEELASIDKILACLADGKDIKNNMENWDNNDIEYLNEYSLLSAKPVMFAVNLNKRDYCRKKNKFLKPIFDWVGKNAPGSAMIPYCGAYEEELQDLDSDDARAKQ